MREIKFRAWDKQRKEMFKVESIVWNRVKQEPSIIGIYNDGFMADHFNEPILMQFTGLKDKNGKEIYEGDVVQYFDTTFSPREIFSIDFVNGMFYLKSAEDEEYNSDMNTAPLEVIGNVWENPELLKEA